MRMPSRMAVMVTVSGLLPALAGGCGPGHGLSLGRVSGKVTHGGEPVKYGTVFFVPDQAKGTNGPSSMATLSPDGTYSLSTDSPGDGALVGFHKVGIVGLDPTPVNPEDKAPPTPVEAPVDFMKARAGIAKARPSAKAAATKGDTFTDKGGKVYRYVIPKKLGNPEESGLTAEVRGSSNQIDFDVKEDGSVDVKK